MFHPYYVDISFNVNDLPELQLHVHLATIDRENQRNLSIMQHSRILILVLNIHVQE